MEGAKKGVAMEDAAEGSKNVLQGRYELGRVLGHGNFGRVHAARDLRTGRGVAVKVVAKDKVERAGMVEQIKREIAVMKMVSHPNIVELHEVMATRSKIYLALELVRGGELFARISRAGRFREDVARRYFRQLVSAVDFCHGRGVYHRDLKPENLLLDEAGNLKVADFGLSALAGHARPDGLLHTACGTPAYVAPEVLGGNGYDGTKADIWSCGVILYVLLVGALPFQDENLMCMYRKMQSRITVVDLQGRKEADRPATRPQPKQPHHSRRPHRVVVVQEDVTRSDTPRGGARAVSGPARQGRRQGRDPRGAEHLPPDLPLRWLRPVAAVRAGPVVVGARCRRARVRHAVRDARAGERRDLAAGRPGNRRGHARDEERRARGASGGRRARAQGAARRGGGDLQRGAVGARGRRQEGRRRHDGVPVLLQRGAPAGAQGHRLGRRRRLVRRPACRHLTSLSSAPPLLRARRNRYPFVVVHYCFGVKVMFACFSITPKLMLLLVWL